MAPDMLEKVIAILTESPSTSARHVAEATGSTAQNVRNACKKHGIKLVDARALGIVRAEGGERKFGHFGMPEQMPSNFVGGACELTAAANLLRSGISVYRALTSVSSADLVADVGRKLYRIEVRAARRNADERFTVTAPADRTRFDVLAIVEGNGDVTYRTNNYGLAPADHEYLNLRELAAHDVFWHERNARRETA